MSKRNKFNERSAASYKRVPKGLETRSGQKEPFIVFSFNGFDRNQGQSFAEWQSLNLLALAIEKLQAISCLTRREVTEKQIIKEYGKGSFPPNSEFHHPKHISADISWCSIRIQGKERIIGYFEENVFNIIFLDKDHEFWKTSKKNT
jgi:hypothetical protein